MLLISYFIVMEVEYKEKISALEHNQLIFLVCQRHVLLLSNLDPVEPFFQLIESLVEILQE